MSFLTDFQRSAVQSAQILLENAGLSPRDLDSFSSSSLPSPSSSSPSPLLSPSSPPSTLPKFCPASLSTHYTCLAVAGTHYTPPPVRPFTAEDHMQGWHCVTHKTSAHAIVEHPIGAIVEYPQTGRHADESIAHIFHIDPSMFTSTLHPKSSFQYSLGDGHGGQIIGKCLMLRDAGGQPVSCAKLRTSCKGLKICSGHQHDISAHHFTNVSEVLAHHPSALQPRGPAGTADQELFEKTLAFFVALCLHGCSPHSPTDGHNNNSIAYTDIVEDSSTDIDDDFEGLTADQYLDSVSTSSDTDLHIGCESDTRYLQALLDDDRHMITECEQLAKSRGYGPLMPCSFVTGPSSQKQVCPHWHRQADGTLKQGVLRKWAHNCVASFDIYVPEDLFACPQILVLCTNPHSHPPPLPVKTPPPLIDVFHGLVSLMKWKLADATPRRIYLDTAFVEGLHQVLDWQFPDGRDAMLQGLHPSLANLDHDLKVHVVLRMNTASLPLEQRYVCCAETHVIDHDCKPNACPLTPRSNEHKDGKSSRLNHGIASIVTLLSALDAFTTSQSTKAHLTLATRFHSNIFMASGAKLSLLTATKAKDLECTVYSFHILSQHHVYMNLTDLTSRGMSMLFTHMFRMKFTQAMLSLATCEEHPDIQRTFNTIRCGGPKAAAWLKDKLEGTKFALPALYQPMSLIPLALWKASPSTTNGNEQAHRNAYREGVHLTLLAGIMKGMKFDQGAMSSMDVHATFGVSTRDQEATQVYHATRCIVWQTLAQKKHCKSSQATATPRPLQLPTVRNVTMPIQPATKHTATTHAITIPLYGMVDKDSTLVTFNEPPSVSLRQPLMPSQISTFNSLSFALQPGARIIDYSLTSILSPSLIIVDDSKWCISTYSSLAGALDEHLKTLGGTVDEAQLQLKQTY
ncbi:hypothetical protein DFJ58DRAFT_732557 [Suillus subalutaceus]|uniref:uncharacterized protein n=1 Tax=Suillus subalutaceus TaxID=48586 RepID=UPI001B86E1C7|nr:uncharacterized protein DFJ58DRAFT_732557 [Suillus subalutaceus]KAG1841105.1 hypothetical protein DFJ58DRAFT_732557 [Suillus subalutaceus]